MVTEREAVRHQKLKGKIFCSDTCKDKSAKEILHTCSVCYTLFDKTTQGIPALGVWVCSDSCREAIVSKKDKELKELKTLVQKNAVTIQERRYQEENKNEIDLDFDFDQDTY